MSNYGNINNSKGRILCIFMSLKLRIDRKFLSVPSSQAHLPSPQAWQHPSPTFYPSRQKLGSDSDNWRTGMQPAHKPSSWHPVRPPDKNPPFYLSSDDEDDDDPNNEIVLTHREVLQQPRGRLRERWLVGNEGRAAGADGARPRERAPSRARQHPREHQGEERGQQEDKRAPPLPPKTIKGLQHQFHM